MKKLFSLMMAAALFSACGGTKGKYVITGTVEGAVDGDTIYLSRVTSDGALKPVSTAIIKAGRFAFTGQTDTIADYFLTTPDMQKATSFFLESGEMTAVLSNESRVTGTVLNDKYQEFKDQMDEAEHRFMNADMTDKEAISGEIVDIILRSTDKNIGSPLGVLLLKQYYKVFTETELSDLLEKVPTHLKTDPMIVQLSAWIDEQQVQIDAAKRTSVGHSFVDLTMQKPDGTEVHLSDYVGKGKYVLVDFWASWCGPCKAETPKLVSLYKQYGGKNFEIVGVSLDDSAAKGGLTAWKKSIKELHITWPQMSDLQYWKSEAVTAYGLTTIPHLILFDREGNVLVRGVEATEMCKRVAELLNKEYSTK